MQRCPACGGARFTGRDVVPGLRVLRCAGCTLLVSRIQRSGPVQAEFERVDERAYHGSVGSARRLQAADILTLLRPHPPGARLLDVGCSFGWFLDEARAAGYEVSGVEPDPRAVAYARTLLGDEVVQHARLEDAALDRPADVVTALDVLEHIPVGEQHGFARLVRAALAPRGLWVVKVPSTEGLYFRLADTLARLAPRLGDPFVRRLWQTEYEFAHTVYFNRRSLTTWLARHGFDVVDWRYLPEVPNATAVDRLTTDGAITRGQARLLAPVIWGVNLVEAARGRSDSLVMVARRGEAGA